MKKQIVVALVGAAVAVAAPANAASPVLFVAPSSSVFAATASTVLRFEDTGAEPASTFDTYVPSGYGVEASAVVGTTIGSVDARARAATGPEVRLTGAVKAADPAQYAQAAASCTPDDLVHDAVWTVGLNGTGQSLPRLVVFVDRDPTGSITGPAARMRSCLPQQPELRLTRMNLTLNGVFTNPAARGGYRWTTIFTTASSVTSSQTIVRLPARLTLARKLIRGSRHRSFVRLTGTVTENGRGARGIRVAVLAGPRASSLRRLAYATSYVGGRFALVAPLRGKTFFRAQVAAPLREAPLSQCAPLSLHPDAVCTSAAYAPFRAETATSSLSPHRSGR
jgi:hypothetical protein